MKGWMCLCHGWRQLLYIFSSFLLVFFSTKYKILLYLKCFWNAKKQVSIYRSSWYLIIVEWASWNTKYMGFCVTWLMVGCGVRCLVKWRWTRVKWSRSLCYFPNLNFLFLIRCEQKRFTVIRWSVIRKWKECNAILVVVIRYIMTDSG